MASEVSSIPNMFYYEGHNNKLVGILALKILFNAFTCRQSFILFLFLFFL